MQVTAGAAYLDNRSQRSLRQAEDRGCSHCWLKSWKQRFAGWPW